jgi:prepilin-type N-terminal cleavage/methylation domain-containing protein
MRRTSATPPGPDLKSRGGYSILEMLVVLALMALTLAIVLPQGAVMLDRLVIHAVQFDFQRQVSDLRREAWRSETPLDLYSTGAADPADANARVIPLRSGWSYRLDRPVRVSAGGVCSPASADIRKHGRVLMHLRTADTACHFIRLD